MPVEDLVSLVGGFGSVVNTGDGADLAFGRLLSRINLGDGNDRFEDVLSNDDLVTLLGGFDDAVNVDDLVTLLGGFGSIVDTGAGDDLAFGRFLSHINLGDGNDRFEDMTAIGDLVDLVGGFGDTGTTDDIVALLGGFGAVVDGGAGDDQAFGRLLSRINLGAGNDRFDDMLTVSDLVSLVGGFGDDGGLVTDLVNLVGGFGDTFDPIDLVTLLGGFGDSDGVVDDLVSLVGGFGSVVETGTGDDIATGRLIKRINLGSGNDQYGDTFSSSKFGEYGSCGHYAFYPEGVAHHSPGSRVRERTLGQTPKETNYPEGVTHPGIVEMCNPFGVVDSIIHPTQGVPARRETRDPGLKCITPLA